MLDAIDDIPSIKTSRQAEIKDALDWIDGLVCSNYLSERQLAELAALFNNLSYLFLYLESNAGYLDPGSLMRWRPEFFGNPARLGRLVATLEASGFDDPQAERVRLAYLEFFRQQLAASVQGGVEVSDAIADVHGSLAALRADQAALVARLGWQGRGSAETAFYTIASETPDPRTRRKLAEAWRRVQARHGPALERSVQATIDERHRRSRAAGHASPLAQSLRRSTLAPDVIARFTDDCLVMALQEEDELDREVLDALAPNLGTQDQTVGPDRARDHFGFFLRQLQGQQAIPLFDVKKCLDFAHQIACDAFGLDLHFDPAASEDNILAHVWQDGRKRGTICFDLWDRPDFPKPANATTSARNRMNWAGQLQLPVAFVSCRFRRRPDGTAGITFQNVHSLLHEFGHAINHVCMERIVPSESGLEYLPVERLETLSMWFERWAFHPTFETAVANCATDLAGIRLAQSIKRMEYRRTHVERAMIAALDLAVSYEGGEVGGRDVRAAYQELDRRLGVSRHCRLEDILPSFGLPMLTANPGCYFAYLWGAAASAQMFQPWRSAKPTQWPSRADAAQAFAHCFDFDAPEPDVSAQAAFAFYRTEASHG